MELKDKLNKILIDNNLNGAKLADMLGIAKSGIYKILRGETKKLQPETVDLINEKFPNYTKEWLNSTLNNTHQINLENKLTKEQVQFISEALILHEKQLRNHPAISKWIKLIESEAQLVVYRKLDNKK